MPGEGGIMGQQEYDRKHSPHLVSFQTIQKTKFGEQNDLSDSQQLLTQVSENKFWTGRFLHYCCFP